MFDLNKKRVYVTCGCSRRHIATLQDAVNRKVIRCSCGTSLRLNDNNGSVRKGVADINKAFRDVENAFKKFGR